MRLIFVISSIVLMFSCNPKINYEADKGNLKNEQSAVLEEETYKKLVDAEFLKYAETSNIDSLMKFSAIYDSENNKFCMIDAEELAEFNFDFFVPKINKMLKKRNSNLYLHVKTTEDLKKNNNILINGEEVKLYTHSELKNENFWGIASRNFFKKVNQILERKNINEKFYLLYGGNDLATILLTEEQFELIKNFYKNNETEIPYKP